MTGVEARRRAFEPLFRAHVDVVRRYVRTQVAADVVDDVVSQTFITAWQRFEEIPSGSVQAWLLGVARNHVRNTWRTQRRSTALVEVIERGRRLDAGGSETAADAVELAPLLIALRELDDSDRELMVLAGWFEMSPAEIAEVIGARSGAVRVRLHRLRKRLADRLSELGEGRETA